MSLSGLRQKLNFRCSPSARCFLTLVLVTILVFSFGFFCGVHLLAKRNQETGNSVQIRKKGAYQFINPLLECDIQGFEFNRKYIPFENEIKHEISNLSKDVYDGNEFAVYFRDLNNGPWFGINEEANFTPASLMKVPLMIAYFKQAENNPSILDEKIEIESADSGYYQNISSGLKLTIGEEYSVEELIDFMIINSDNGAMLTLLNYIDPAQLESVYTDLGITVPNIRTPEDYMSVKEYASFFRIMYNAAYLDDEYSEKALDLLSRGQFHAGLVAGVPAGIKVSHKFGERKNIYFGQQTDQLHECGIIYYPDQPYLLCVMTRGNDLNVLANFIKDVSKSVYEQINKNHESK